MQLLLFLIKYEFEVFFPIRFGSAGESWCKKVKVSFMLRGCCESCKIAAARHCCGCHEAPKYNEITAKLVQSGMESDL